MTTNHRPQLEGKRGRDIAIKNTIQHARSQPGQTKLKIRLDIVGATVSEETGKRALEDMQAGEKRPKLLLESAEDQTADPKDKDSKKKENETETERSNPEREVLEGTNDSVSESDLESEDETEALLAELAETRKENEAKKDVSIAENETPKKRSWRSKSAFSRKPESSSTYTTDALKSKAHQKFLSDFIR